MPKENSSQHILPHTIFSSAIELESELVKSALSGALVLTATGRLSRRILHCFRQKRIEEKAQGWPTPAVFSFNRWVKDTFATLWTPFLSLSKMGALRLWHEAAQRVASLEGLDQTPSLYLELQRTFDVLTRHRHEVIGSPDNHPLVDWRRNVSGHFLNLLEGCRYVSWAGVLDAVGKAIAQEKVGLPEEVILAGFDEFSPMEETFVQILSEKTRVILYRAQREPDEKANVRVYATPEQECQAICAEVLNIWNQGQRRLGIVFFEEDYFSLIKRCFEELTDREVKPQDALRYNLTMGTPLSAHPLFQTALLPLRLLDEPAPYLLLSSLLCSPYLKKQRDEWDHDVRTALWNPGTPGTLTENLARLQSASFPVKLISILSGYQEELVKVWLDTLKHLWEELGFPLCGCETDTLAKEHLFSILEEVEREVGYLKARGKTLLAWFTAAAQGIEVVEKTPELAGIQVLNAVESRGLAFDRLWVVGTHGHVLPAPVRERPFLDPDERRKVEGGTVEGQWEAGKRTFSYLLAAAPLIRFSRAAARGEEEPYLECPLIPDESPREGPHYIVDLWKDPPGEWMRARWLREGITGLQNMDGKGMQKEEERVNLSLPQVLNVTGLETILSCPFKYFAGNLLSLEPLEDPTMGITPLERGAVIHRIVRDFTCGVTTAVPKWPEDGGKANEFLKKTVDRVLAEKPDNLFWKVERLRLLGDDTSSGLLSVWLERERERAREGWKIEAAEKLFEGIHLGDSGVMLRGKVDRIDSHPQEGIVIWDYKTGDVPAIKTIFDEKLAPQLPAYLLALMRNLIPQVDSSGRQMGAGYIRLKKASEVAISLLKNKRAWEEFLAEWEHEVKERLSGALNGLYPSEPRPSPSGKRGYKSACEYCGYLNLCNYGEVLEEEAEGETPEE